MKTITQLRDELAEAEQAQRKKSADDFVKSFKEKLEGKYFLSTWTYQGGRGASVEHYKNIRLESHSAGPDSPMVKYTRRWKIRNLIRMCNKLLDEDDRLLAKARKKGLLP